jgi:dethiobiotin synthetase
VSWFVTGTDTGVGKTHTILQLLRLLRRAGVACAGFKPICCGDRRDAELLLASGAEGLVIDEINPLWLKTPLAPFAAARIEGAKIDVEQIMSAFRALQRRVETVIVEGVGGWLVPIRTDYFVSDLATDMKLPVLAVVQNRLGCLNHTALTVQSVLEHGLPCAGVVLNDVLGADDLATTTNAEVLHEILSVPILPALSENMSELPPVWRELAGLGVTASAVSGGDTSVNKLYTKPADSAGSRS